MRIRVLGSGAGGGFPQWNCNCPNCDRFRKGSIQAKRRTQSSIAVSSDSVQWVLFNCSPDILTQINAFPSLQPSRSIRDTGINSIILMDSQIDHTTGLLMLRESTSPLNIYCTEAVHHDLTEHNPLFKVLSHYCKVNWHPIQYKEFEIPGIDGLKFTAYPLKSKAPPYSPRRNQAQPIQSAAQNITIGETIGVAIEDLKTHKRLFYAPGLGEMEPHVAQQFSAADCLMVDGTFWSEDEMPKLKIAPKFASALGHLPQSGPGGMIEVLSALTKPRKILIHINNTNPILDEESGEFLALKTAQIEVARDEMEIIL